MRKYNIGYCLYILSLVVLTFMESFFLFKLRQGADAFSGMSYIAYGNLSYILTGGLIAIERMLSSKASPKIREYSRLAAIVFLGIELFRLPLFKSWSMLNEYALISGTAGIICGYLLILLVFELIHKSR